MSRPKSVQLIMEGPKRIVSIHFTDTIPPEHFMDINVKVERGGVMLSAPRYGGQIFFPIEAVDVIMDTIRETADA